MFHLVKQAADIYLHHLSGFDLDEMKGEKNINLGCGNKRLEDFVNTDKLDSQFADEVFDLNYDFPFNEASCDLIYSDNVFEHIADTVGLVDKCFKCLKPGGYLVVKVPYFKSSHAFVDPTHVTFFSIQTLDYFVQNKYFNKEYKLTENYFRSIDIFFDLGPIPYLKNLIACYAIQRPIHFENSILSLLFLFHNITYVLRK